MAYRQLTQSQMPQEHETATTLPPKTGPRDRSPQIRVFQHKMFTMLLFLKILEEDFLESSTLCSFQNETLGNKPSKEA